jgi:hypothetical protein
VVKPSKAEADHYAEVLLAGLRAAVVAPEPELRSWFSWPIPADVLDRMVQSGRATRPAPGWLAIAD